MSVNQDRLFSRRRHTKETRDAAMAIPGKPLQVDGKVASKRTLASEGDCPTPTKRRKHQPIDVESATRPRLSGECLWTSSYTKLPLYCSDADKETFGIRFKCLDLTTDDDGRRNRGQRGRRNKRSASERESLYQPTRLQSARELRCNYGDMGRKAMATLFESCGLRPWRHGREQRLQVRYGTDSSRVETDGVFKNPYTGKVVAYADFANMEQRRTKHVTDLLPGARGEEEKERRELRAMESVRITPKKREEDAQIAMMMAAMVQEILRSGGQEQLGGAWAHVVGVGRDKIFMYRAWIPRRFVERFQGDVGFEVEYQSTFLDDESRVVRRLDRWLRKCNMVGEECGAVGAAN